MDRNKKSFTLIEVLVVTVIIVIMSGASIALFSSFKDNRVLNNQTQLFVNTLELAKNKATAGDVSSCSSSTTAHVSGYSVSVNSAAHTITVLPACDTTPTPFIHTIPSNIVYIPDTFTVQFDTQNYVGAAASFILKNMDTSTCTLVEISDSGLITNADITCP
jgi:Tfp pilus assembly protein FimT